MRTFGTHLVNRLGAYGVDTIFGIPGVHTLELYRGLTDNGIRHITPRHEQGAGFMADGYARVTGKPGVCLVITGPGLTNIATAVAQAYGDSVPMLVISSVNARGEMGSGAGYLHELPDQRQLMAQITAFSHTLLKQEELETVLARAFAVFASARPRPVHIEVPLDLLLEDCTEPQAVAAPPMPGRAAPTAQDIDAAVALCNASASCVIIAGGGASSGAQAVRRLAETLDAPVVMTSNGRGVLAGSHPLAIPCRPGRTPCRNLIADAALVIAVGTEFGPTDFENEISPLPEICGKLIRIDIDAQQIMRGRRADLPILADAALTCDILAARVERRTATDGAGIAQATRAAVFRALSPTRQAGLRLIDTVRDTLPGAVVVGDSAQPVYGACNAYGPDAPRSWFCSAMGYGTLGYALPAAIGAALGAGERPVVCVIGDGGIQFTLAELGAARESGTNIIILLWNNSGYREIKEAMTEHGIAPVGVDIFTPDFLAIATAFGCKAVRLGDPADLPDALRDGARAGRPVLIDIDEQAFVDFCAAEHS